VGGKCDNKEGCLNGADPFPLRFWDIREEVILQKFRKFVTNSDLVMLQPTSG
jgi:hypothetical protein